MPVGRLPLVCVSVLFGLAAAFPEFALAPLHSLITQMKQPQQAVPTARLFFVAASLSFAAIAAYGQQLALATIRSVDRILAWRGRTYWAIAFAVAVILRLAVGLGIPYEPTSDALWYHQVAASIASGHGASMDGAPTAYRGIAYPFLLSLPYRAWSAHVGWAWLIGALATAVLMVATFKVADVLYGHAVARIATLLTSAYPALVLMTGQAMSDLVFGAALWLLLAAVLVAPTFSGRRALAIGFASGLLTLCRGFGIGLFLLLPLIWLLKTRWDGPRLRRSLLFATLGFLCATAPWVARNQAVMGGLALTTNLGNVVSDGWHVDERAVVAKLGTHRLNELEAGRVRLATAIEQIAQQPVEALLMLPRKFFALYALELSAVTSYFQGERRGSDWLKRTLQIVSQLSYMLVLAGVLLRLMSWRDPQKRPTGLQWSGWIVAAYLTALCLLMHAEDRYRLPILPLMILECTVGWATYLKLTGAGRPATGR